LISTTVGQNLDPDGYTFVLNGGTAQAIAINDTVTINGLNPGPQSVTLGGLTTNCNPFSSAPISASVTAGVVTDVSLGVECLGPVPVDVSLTFVRARLVEPFTNNIAGLLAGSGSVEDFTFHPATDRGPDWSPDGTKLAFSRNGVIHVVNADGTGLRSFGTRGLGTNPAWSPDGTTIAYDNGSRILVFSPDGVGETVVATGIQPAWSPDGARIAGEIEGASAFEGDIVVMNADGSGVVNITQAPQLLDREPTWSPDGLRIAFRRLNRVEVGGYELWVIDADGSNGAKLLAMAGAQLNPKWLPDNRILFGDNSSGTIMALDMSAGGAVSQLTDEPGFSHFDPAWR
jgi:TolB protein